MPRIPINSRSVAILTLVLAACPGGYPSDDVDRLIGELRVAVVRGDYVEMESDVRALEDIGPSAVAEIGRLLADPDDAVSAAARRVLTSPGRQAALDLYVRRAVIDAVEASSSRRVRPPAWYGLRRLGVEAMPAVARTYSLWVPERQRLVMVEVASECLDIGAVPVIMLGLRDPSPRVVATAARGLGSIGGRGALLRLEQLLGDPSLVVRDAAIDGMRELDDPDAVRYLVRVLDATDEPLENDPIRGSRIDVGRHFPGSTVVDSHMLKVPRTLHENAAMTIDLLTGQHFGGDIAAIRRWLQEREGGGRSVYPIGAIQ
jgi:hypothetical protein